IMQRLDIEKHRRLDIERALSHDRVFAEPAIGAVGNAGAWKPGSVVDIDRKPFAVELLDLYLITECARHDALDCGGGPPDPAKQSAKMNQRRVRRFHPA